MHQDEVGSNVKSGLVNISRRSFLKVLGAASAGTAIGCASDNSQKIYPYVKGEVEQIPGKAVWYKSTCTECSAGCGINIRTREGRAVKVEGNDLSPVNKGGLCALGQASLQSLYDPDRIREPLMFDRMMPEGPTFKPVTWDVALQAVTKALSESKGKKVFITGEVTTSHNDIIKEACASWEAEQVVWEPLSPTALAKSSEEDFGVYGVPEYSIDKAEVLLNFGADFLETWISPCEYARQWAIAKKAEKPLRFIHVEPRLSLTGGNADMWLRAKLGTEVTLAWGILGLLLQRGKGASVRPDLRAALVEKAKPFTSQMVADVTGVSKEKILLVVDYLAEAKTSLVLAGGTASASEEQMPLYAVTNLLNLVLGNIGTTVKPSSFKQPTSSLKKMIEVTKELSGKESKTEVVFIYGTNPQFTLPGGVGFDYALKNVSAGNGKDRAPGKVIAFASQLDETAMLADIILPVNTGLEDWGYQDIGRNRTSLVQPGMAKVFDTKPFGQVLLDIGKAINKPVKGDYADYFSFVKQRFLKRVPSGDLERIWLESLERGGWFDSGALNENYRIAIDSSKIEAPHVGHAHTERGLLLYPYPSVKSFDGRAANRPWLQELPDPVAQIVWDTWFEVHPDTAKELGVVHSDSITIRTEEGEVTAPVFVSEWVDREILAMPLGQGHKNYGRYATQVGDGNIYSLFSEALAKDVDSYALASLRVKPFKARGTRKLISVQGSDSQHGRELARTTFVGAALANAGAAHAAEGHHEAGSGHGESHGNGHAEHHEPKQMYEQREHPLYQWGMAIDLATCTGCSACIVACSAENNIAIVGKSVIAQGREMAWLRIERYYDEVETADGAMELKVSFLPMLCQHCQNAPCEPVCPVYATYHNDEGMNAMVYNRCVGTRYCLNNCSYKVRRFNWFEHQLPEPMDWQLNPDVTKRSVGVMEKCTFCTQRIAEAKDNAKDLGRIVEDGEVQPACVQSCPTQALTFGNLKDPNSKVSKLAKDKRAYKVLDHHINTQPSVIYLEDVRYKA